MEVFSGLSVVSLSEGVDLDPEGNSLLSSMLPGGELCTDAVNLHTHTRKVRLKDGENRD